MKKLLLTLGTVAAVAAPVASVIACGSSTDAEETSVAVFDETTNKLTITIDLKATDFEPHIAGSAAIAAEAALKKQKVTAGDVKNVIINLNDGSKKFTATEAVVVDPANLGDKEDDALNEAINDVVENLSKQDTSHDIGYDSKEYIDLTIKNIKAIADGELTLDKVRKLFTAFGNPTQVKSLTELDPVFGAPFILKTHVHDIDMKVKLLDMITKKAWGDKLDDSIYAALLQKVNALVPKVTYINGQTSMFEVAVATIKAQDADKVILKAPAQVMTVVPEINNIKGAYKAVEVKGHLATPVNGDQLDFGIYPLKTILHLEFKGGEWTLISADKDATNWADFLIA